MIPNIISSSVITPYWRENLTGEPFRLLVTGSRRLRDRERVTRALDLVLDAARTPLRLTQGGAEGADSFAEQWALAKREQGINVRIKTVEARWTDPCRATCRPGHRKVHPNGREYCPAAGNYRNEEMCLDGQDLCLGFPFGLSTGTWDCLNRALKCHIPIITIEA